MKTIRLKQTALVALAAVALACSTTRTQAQTFPSASYTNNFDRGGATAPFSGTGSVASWLYWYSIFGNVSMTNDPTHADPVAGDPDSGSVIFDVPFTTSANQQLFFGTFGNGGQYDFSQMVDFANFDTISFDILVNTNLPPDNGGNFGTIGVGIINSGYGYQEFARPTVPGSASNGWVRLSVNIDHTQNNLASVPGICLNYNSYGGFPTNAFRMWVGHLIVHYNPAPPPRPTVTLKKTLPGLTQFADSAPTYDRFDVRTDNSGTANLTWFGRTKPVSYSWTISDFPKAGHPGYQAGLTLTPDPLAVQIWSDPDWSSSNCLWININEQADASVIAGIAWKTNQNNGNSQMFGAGTGILVDGSTSNGLHAATAVGTWTLTFTSDTDMTLTGPGGVSTNASLPSNIAALFNGYVGAFLYTSIGGQNANLGQTATLTKYQVTGTATPVNEDFTSGAISSAFLILNSQNFFYTGNYITNPPNQQFATSADAFWFSDSLPDNGYSPVFNTNAPPVNLQNLPNPLLLTSAGTHVYKITKAQLPAGNQVYFRMISRPFTQLQILFPGETNAPGIGKTGSPTPVNVGDIVNVTVMSVDSQFNPVNNNSDFIAISSATDPGATLGAPVQLANGIAILQIAYDAPGSQTATATDTTNTNIPPVVSSSITVN